jgi:hypothetical protein
MEKSISMLKIINTINHLKPVHLIVFLILMGINYRLPHGTMCSSANAAVVNDSAPADQNLIQARILQATRSGRSMNGWLKQKVRSKYQPAKKFASTSARQEQRTYRLYRRWSPTLYT